MQPSVSSSCPAHMSASGTGIILMPGSCGWETAADVHGRKVMSISRYSCIMAPKECIVPCGLTEDASQISCFIKVRFLLERNACAFSEDCFGMKLFILPSLLVAGYAHVMASEGKFRGVR